MITAIMSVPNVIAKSCAPEFFLSGTRVAMVNPVLTYTKASAALPIGQKIIYPGIHEQTTGTCQENSGTFGLENGPHLQGRMIARITRPLSKSTIQRMKTYPNHRYNSHPTEITKQTRNSALFSNTSSNHSTDCKLNSPKSHGCTANISGLPQEELTNISSNIKPYPPDIQRSRFSAKFECNNKQKNKSADEFNPHDGSSDNFPKAGKGMEETTGSTISIKDILESVMHDKELGTSEASEENDSEKLSQDRSTPSLKQHKKRRQRWKSGRKSRLKNHRQKKVRSISIGTPAEITKNKKNSVLMDVYSKPLKFTHPCPPDTSHCNKVIAGAIHRNALNATQTVAATFCLSAEGHPSQKLNSNSVSPRRSHPHSFMPRRASDGTRESVRVLRPVEVERTMKVYLSQAQTSMLQELGMEFPGAPPATPMPDHLRQYEYVPCMYDIRAQRAVKMQLEGILAKELKRKEKLMEEKLRLDRQQQKQREKELRQQQRREIYALNKVMTELENQNFENFIAAHGLNEKKSRKT